MTAAAAATTGMATGDAAATTGVVAITGAAGCTLTGVRGVAFTGVAIGEHGGSAFVFVRAGVLEVFADVVGGMSYFCI